MWIMHLNTLCLVSSLNADDIRRIQIEVLFDIGLISDPELIKDVKFVDEVSKAEIVNRKILDKLVEIVDL